MFDGIKDSVRIWKAIRQYEVIKKEAQTMDSKNILFSKTFWLNVVGLVITVSGILPPKYGVPILAVANVIMRLLSSGEVTLRP